MLYTPGCFIGSLLIQLSVSSYDLILQLNCLLV